MNGALALVLGFGFVARTPRAWPLAAAPVAIFVALLAVLGSLAVWGAASLGSSLVVHIALGVGLVLLAVLLAMALAQPLAGPFLDRLVALQEEALGLAPPPPEPFARSFARSLRVTFAGLLVALPLLALLTVVGLLVPPALVVTMPLKGLLSAALLAWDALDYPLSRRGWGVRERLRWMTERKGDVLGFGIAAAVLLLIPGAGLVAIPVGITGATRLSAEGASARVLR